MNSAVTEQPIETILSASINIKTCKTCQKELANQKRIYCSNPCKFADKEYNKSRVDQSKNDIFKQLKCKHCGWVTTDYLNKAGAITNHLKRKHEIVFVRETYLENFKKIELKEEDFYKCSLCDWRTEDIINKSGCITNHLKNSHDIGIEKAIELKLLDNINSKQKEKTLKKQFLQKNEDARVKCEECGEFFEKLTVTHLKFHNLTPKEYKLKYNINNLWSELLIKEQSELSSARQKDGIFDRITAHDCTPMFDKEKEFLGVTNNRLYSFKCNICSTIFDHSLDGGKGPVCKICHPSLLLKPNKKLENEIYEFLNSILPNQIQTNDRLVIAPQELDFYIESKKVGIEIDGLYWHSEMYKSAEYHEQKTLKMNQLGLKLIHIFEDEWNDKKEIVKNKLKHILDMNNASEKLYARNCYIKEIDSKSCNAFLDKHHIQGEDKSKFRYGLFDKKLNDLVSVATFSTPRIAMGQSEKQVGIFELVRFAAINDRVVVGGAGKLLAHFVKTHDPKQIYTYADARWSDSENNLYTKLGFSLVHKTNPNYFWCKSSKREHRYKFAKHKLVEQGFDAAKTEVDIMHDRCYYRIWDCGHYKYQLRF